MPVEIFARPGYRTIEDSKANAQLRFCVRIPVLILRNSTLGVEISAAVWITPCAGIQRLLPVRRIRLLPTHFQATMTRNKHFAVCTNSRFIGYYPV